MNAQKRIKVTDMPTILAKSSGCRTVSMSASAIGYPKKAAALTNTARAPRSKGSVSRFAVFKSASHVIHQPINTDGFVEQVGRAQAQSRLNGGMTSPVPGDE